MDSCLIAAKAPCLSNAVCSDSSSLHVSGSRLEESEVLGIQLSSERSVIRVNLL
jgi:hypothetical protein